VVVAPSVVSVESDSTQAASSSGNTTVAKIGIERFLVLIGSGLLLAVDALHSPCGALRELTLAPEGCAHTAHPYDQRTRFDRMDAARPGVVFPDQAAARLFAARAPAPGSEEERTR
jgi:hypothetical protein